MVLLIKFIFATKTYIKYGYKKIYLHEKISWQLYISKPETNKKNQDSSRIYFVTLISYYLIYVNVIVIHLDSLKLACKSLQYKS